MALILSCHMRALRSASVVTVGVEHPPRKIFPNATESAAWAGATVH